MPPNLTEALAELSDADRLVVERLLDSKQQLTDLIPDSIDGAELWRSLAACCKSLSMYRKSASVLKIVIGRLLVVLQDRPQIYRDLGYPTFDAFLTKGMPELFGIPRSEAYGARALMTKWPTLSAEQIKTVSYSKLSLISKFTSEESADANRYLELAQIHTMDELKDICANNGVLPRGDSDLVSITILTTKNVKDMWLEAVNDPQIRAYCQTDDQGVILECLLSESLAEWRGRMLLQMQNSQAGWIPRAAEA